MPQSRVRGALYLVGVAAIVVAVGFFALREMHARSPLIRAWVTAGTALILLAAGFVLLD